MKIDINSLAEYFLDMPIKVEGIYRFTHRPGKAWPKYTENFSGFIFPLSGKLKFGFDETVYNFTPGKVIHAGPRMRLEQVDGEISGWEYILVQYEVLDGENKNYNISNMHFELDIENTPKLHNLLEKLWEVSFHSGYRAEFKTKALFYDLIDEVFSCIRTGEEDNSRILFEQVSEYMHEHYGEAIDIPSLAEMNKVNRNRLYYVFKKYSGMGPGDYLLNYRLNRGREIVFVENLDIQEISESVGFNDPFYFSRAFKKKFGVSPTDYRKKS